MSLHIQKLFPRKYVIRTGTLIQFVSAREEFDEPRISLDQRRMKPNDGLLEYELC
jgi:hypothetical protein